MRGKNRGQRRGIKLRGKRREYSRENFGTARIKQHALTAMCYQIFVGINQKIRLVRITNNGDPFVRSVLENCFCYFLPLLMSGEKRRAPQRLQRTANFFNDSVKLAGNLRQRRSKGLAVSRFDLG